MLQSSVKYHRIANALGFLERWCHALGRSEAREEIGLDFCDLHTGELPLRKLIIELDGKTLSNNKWSGDIGQMGVTSDSSHSLSFIFTLLCLRT